MKVFNSFVNHCSAIYVYFIYSEGRHTEQVLTQLGLKHLVKSNILIMLCIYSLTNSAMATSQNSNRLALFDSAEVMLNTGNASTAYEMLSSELATLAGNEEFDYLLGWSALESGQPGMAIFSLERVVATNPKHGGAYLELGRAYFKIKQYKPAQLAFNSALELHPPKHIETRIRDYIIQIENFNKKQTTNFHFDIQLSSGNDSNVNSATNDEVFGTWIINEANTKQASAFNSIDLNAKHATKLSKTLTSQTVVNHKQTEYRGSATAANLKSNSFVSGLNYKINNTTNFMLTGLINDIAIANNFFRTTTGFNLALGHTISAKQQLGFNTQVFTNSFTKSVSAQNTNSLGLTISSSQILKIQQDNWFTRVYIGTNKDLPTNSNGTYGKTTSLVGLHSILGFNQKVSFKQNLNLAYSAYTSSFLNGNNFDFSKRYDQQVSVSFGVDIKPTKQWIVNPYINVINRRSNIELYQFSRMIVGLNVRRQLI